MGTMGNGTTSKVLATAKCETQYRKYVLRLIMIEDYRKRRYKIVRRMKYGSGDTWHEKTIRYPLSFDMGMRDMSEIVERVNRTGEAPW